MNYFDLPCPACGEIMKDGDDIVVCPECATPHHRECWNKNGHCINSGLHDEGFVWSARSSSKKHEENIPKNEEQPSQESKENTVCHICGSENPSDVLHCGNCGALLGETEVPEKNCPLCGAQNPANELFCSSCGSPLTTQENPFVHNSGIDENEIIGSHTAGDYALYTQLNAKNYIPKFRKLEAKKITFNWGAFVFGANWFLFRKIYKAGIILLIVFASITMMTAPLQSRLIEATEEFYSLSQPIIEAANSENAITASDAQIEKIINDYYAATKNPMLILSAVFLLQRLVCGFIADKIYYKKVNSDLKIIGETVDDKIVRKMMIARRGSVSFAAFFAGNLGEQVLLNLLVLAADAVSGVL